jgi:hypothetical protein
LKSLQASLAPTSAGVRLHGTAAAAADAIYCCCRVLRHGRSKANEAGIIVSSLENGVKPEHGLAESGFIQAAAAG